MKKAFTLLTFIVLFAASACKKDDDFTPEIAAKFGEDFKILPSQMVTLSEDNAELPSVKFKLAEAIEGRCPSASGMTCLVAGYATVKIVSENNNFNDLQMCIGDCFPIDENKKGYRQTDSITFTSNNQKYMLILKGIKSDYNKKKMKSTVKDVTLFVTKQ